MAVGLHTEDNSGTKDDPFAVNFLSRIIFITNIWIEQILFLYYPRCSWSLLLTVNFNYYRFLILLKLNNSFFSFQIPRARGIFRKVDSGTDVTTRQIIKRIVSNRYAHVLISYWLVTYLVVRPFDQSLYLPVLPFRVYWAKRLKL